MNSEPEKTSSRRRLGGVAMLAGVAIVLSACASAPLPPQVELDAAQSAISVAETANAGRFAAAELSEARDKLARANSAA